MRFLDLLRALTPLFGPILSAAVPSLHPAAIDHIVAGVAGAEALGVPGTDKLTAAISIAQQGVQAAAAAGVPIDAAAASTAIASGTQVVVDVVNALHKSAAVNPAGGA